MAAQAIRLVSGTSAVDYPNKFELPPGAVFSGGRSNDLEIRIGAAEYVLQERGAVNVYRQVR